MNLEKKPIQIADAKKRLDELKIKAESLKRELDKEKDIVAKKFKTTDPVKLGKLKSKLLSKLDQSGNELYSLRKKIDRMLSKYGI
jgi:DNA-directed RNA polymerase subunit F